MARYDPHKNRGFDGYGQPAYGGGQAAIVGYHHSTLKSYVASTEEVVSLGGGYPATTHGQVRRPRNPTRVQLDDNSSPKFSHTNGSPRDYSPKFNSSPHDSPRKTFQRAHSPPPARHSGLISPHDSPRKDFRGGFSSGDDESSDDDVECRDGVCYPKPKHGGYGGGGGNYHHQPIKDSQYHHQASDPHNYHEKLPEGNKMYGPNSYTHTKPVIDPYYDRNNGYTNSKNGPHYGKSNNSTLPAPIKTRAPDHYPDAKYSSVSAASTHWTPFGPTSPRKDRQEVRNGNAPPHSADHKNKQTIDSETAAKMYGGVFVK